MLERFDRFFVRANQVLIGLMMLVMFILVFINVVGRYGFNVSYARRGDLHLSYDLGRLPGRRSRLREGRHAAIDMIQDKLPVNLRRLCAGCSEGSSCLLRHAGLARHSDVDLRLVPGDIAPRSHGHPLPGHSLGALIFCMHLILTFKD